MSDRYLGHSFCPISEYCIHCGASATALVAAGVPCYPDTTNLVAFRPYWARRQMDQILKPDVVLTNILGDHID